MTVCSPMVCETVSGRIRTFLVGLDLVTDFDPVPDLYGSIYGYRSGSRYGSNFVYSMYPVPNMDPVPNIDPVPNMDPVGPYSTLL
jgi:hypothetical protein